jgi:hypothetical protein
MVEVVENIHHLRGSSQPAPVTAAQADSGQVLREARALVGGAVGEIQAQWRSFRSELREEQQTHARRLEDALEQRHDASTSAARLQEIEAQIDKVFTHWGQQQQQQPAWFEQLEEVVASLERRIEEQRAVVDVRLQQVRADTDGLRLRSDGLQGRHEDLLCTVEQRVEEVVARCVEQELDRLASGAYALEGLHRNFEGPITGTDSSARTARTVQELARRTDEIDSRVAALRVRVEAHDGRFAAVSERTEAVCQQAVESARQAALQLREEILSESDCQIRILKQRIDALGELCDELTLREVTTSRTSLSQLLPTPSTAGRGAVPSRYSEKKRLSEEKL